MKKISLLLCLLLILSCVLVLAACDTSSANGSEVPAAPAADAEEGIDSHLFIKACQHGESNLLQLSWNFYDFDFETYKDLKAEFYYGDRLLAARDLGTASSQLAEEVCYGRVTVRITANHSEKGRVTIKECVAPLSASEYNFASINASMPVLYFSLDLFSRDGATREAYLASSSIPDSFLMADVPTFVALERVNSYDWDSLPENVYWLPALEEPNGSFHKNNELMAAYIRELYEINPDSKFNFYCTDNYPELIVKFFTAQGIENFHATMLSDGTGSAALFKNLAANENGKTASEMYKAMVEEWVRIKTAAQNGAADYLDDVFMGFETHSVLQNYPFVMAALEDNITWVCARESVFTDSITDSAFRAIWDAAKADGSVQFIGFNHLFNNLSLTDSNRLKQLYKFDTDVFSAAGEKPILMYLGTSTSGEGNLEAYLRYLIKEYGDTYAIYYKGHPGWPTALNAEKKAMLEELGVIDVESYIAAEIILFYCPDIYLAGYNSSTYYSADSDHVLAIFEATESYVNSNSTYTSEVYINPVSSFTEYAALYPDCYVVEYRDSNRVDIYNPADGSYTTVVPAV